MRRAIGADGMRGLVLSALAFALTGCIATDKASENATGTANNATPDTCAKAEFASLVGTPINSAELPLTQTYRVLFPDTVASTDFVADRMQVAVDDTGIVTGLTCG